MAVDGGRGGEGGGVGLGCLQADFYYVEGLACGITKVSKVGGKREDAGEMGRRERDSPISTWAMPPAAPEKRSLAVCIALDGACASMSAAESPIFVLSFCPVLSSRLLRPREVNLCLEIGQDFGGWTECECR